MFGVPVAKLKQMRTKSVFIEVELRQWMIHRKVIGAFAREKGGETFWCHHVTVVCLGWDCCSDLHDSVYNSCNHLFLAMCDQICHLAYSFNRICFSIPWNSFSAATEVRYKDSVRNLAPLSGMYANYRFTFLLVSEPQKYITRENGTTVVSRTP